MLRVGRKHICGLVSLASVLMVVGVAILAAFMLAGLTVTHLRLLSRNASRATAQDLAESAIGVAMAAIQTQPTSVPPGGKYTYEVGPSVQAGSFPDAPPGAVGVVTFDTNFTWPGQEGPLPWSTSAILSNNNVSTNVFTAYLDEPNAPASTTVNKHTVRLIGTGICGDVRRSVMVVLYWPPFPDCVACSGQINSAASLYVAGVVNPSYPNVTASPNIAPGDILSNAAANPGVTLAANSQIFGNVISAGTIDVGSNVNITGQIEQNQTPAALPYLNVPSMVQGVTALPCWICCPWDKLKPISSMAGGTLAQGFYHCSGDMVVNGTLTLQNAVIAIDKNGSFTCTGGVNGYGAIITEGNPTTHLGITIMGSSDLASIGDATNRVALISEQDIYVGTSPSLGCAPGPCPGSSYFEGLVYTGRNLHAANITLLGAFVANATGPSCNPLPCPGPCAGGMTISNVKIYEAASYSTILIQQEIAGCGPPSLGFHDAGCCFWMNYGTMGLYGGSCGGAWQANCAKIQVPVVPITACKFACTTFCLSGDVVSGFNPCCSKGNCAVVNQIGCIVCHKVCSTFCIMFSPLGGSAMCWCAFNHSRPAIKARLMQLASEAKSANFVCPCPAQKYSFGTDQDSFLGPANQVRILLWEPLQTLL